MQIRSPILYYLATLLTSGIFMFFWLYTLMSDLNGIFGSRVIKAGPITTALTATCTYGVSVIVYGSTSSAAVQGSEWFGIAEKVFVITWLLMVVGVFALVLRIYALALRADGKKFTIRNALSILGLSLIYWVSLPYLQVQINRLVRKSLHTKATAEVFA